MTPEIESIYNLALSLWDREGPYHFPASRMVPETLILNRMEVGDMDEYPFFLVTLSIAPADEPAWGELDYIDFSDFVSLYPDILGASSQNAQRRALITQILENLRRVGYAHGWRDGECVTLVSRCSRGGRYLTFSACRN